MQSPNNRSYNRDGETHPAITVHSSYPTSKNSHGYSSTHPTYSSHGTYIGKARDPLGRETATREEHGYESYLKEIKEAEI